MIEHKQADVECENLIEQLETSLGQLEAVVNSMTEGFIVSDPAGNVVSMNPAALRIHEYRSVEEVRRHLEDPDTFELYHLDGRLIPVNDWPLARALRGEAFSNYEVQVHRVDTGTVWIGNYGGMLVHNKTEKVILAIVTVRDVTEQKQTEVALRDSEDRLRLALEGSDLGMWDYDLLTGRLSWSKQCKRLFGLVPDDSDINYEIFRNAIYSEDREWVDQAVSHAIDEGRDYDIEYRTLWPDGTLNWIAAKGRALYNDGQPFRMLGTAQDINERKQIEQERAQILARERAARAESEAVGRMKDEFLAIISHELRTPLNAILGWSQLLRSRQFDQAKTEQALEAIARNAKSQAQLIEELLDISQLMRGKLQLDVSPVKLASIIEDASNTVRPVADAKSIKIELILDPSATSISGDSRRLRQIVWNLLSNAIKFTPEGGRVEVRLERFGSQAQIQVSDTGQGISSDFLPYVFDRFRQADSTITRSVGGLGLGLAIVRQLVELHGGTVSVASPGEGQGATFTVKFPLHI